MTCFFILQCYRGLMLVSPPEYVVKVFGGQTAVANILDVCRQSVQTWIYRGWVPRKHYVSLMDEATAQGVDLTYEDLVVGRKVNKREWEAA